jgi:hypothetical protein
MLQFYYDFVNVFVDRRDFQYCAMDTDSAYMALSGETLEETGKQFVVWEDSDQQGAPC